MLAIFGWLLYTFGQVDTSLWPSISDWLWFSATMDLICLAIIGALLVALAVFKAIGAVITKHRKEEDNLI